MSLASPTALIADDERLLRDHLRTRLAVAWPELRIVAEAKNGTEALAKFQEHKPDVVFLDIRMPGLTGVEVASRIAQLDGPDDAAMPAIVFVTAYDAHAIEAFEQGAVDYVLKPAEPERLAKTVTRIQARLLSTESTSGNLQAILHGLGAHLSGRIPKYLDVIQASVGSTVHIIPVEEILFFVSDEKYTRVQTERTEGIIRKPIRELVEELDPQRFWQIHRGTIVNVRAIASVDRDDRDQARVHVRGYADTLAVSRRFSGLFRGM